MKTRLIQIAAMLLLLGASGLAGATENAAPTPAVSADASQPPAETRDRLAWQRVGAPEETTG